MTLSPELAQEPAVLAARLQAAESALQRIVEVSQQNQNAIKQAFLYSDAHLFVLKTISCDIVMNRVKKLPDGEVDLQTYYKDFNEQYARDRIAEAQARQAAKDAIDSATKTDEEPAEVDDADDSTTVFGGDAAPAQQQEAAHVQSP